ncbi:MAG: heparan-alpha-glucosaminide N-acetyltransferase [Candidatus Nanoarchaeia archaeon]|jgi:uncharacterized membrane protein
MARFWELDFFRGAAVIMMIIFHFLFYLDYFGFMKLSLYSGFIGKFQMTIPLIFLTVSGISSSIQARVFGKKSVLIRGFNIFGLALLITIATFLLFPHDFVFFGILHCIGACIILSYFISNKKLALIFGIAILFISEFINNYAVNFKYLSILGFNYANLSTFDYYPLIPWLGVFLIGTYLGSEFYKNRKAKKMKNGIINSVCFMGKHSLKIYFIHIIVLFSAFWALRNLLA